MWLIQYAIFGLVAGAIARLLHPGRDPMNWVWTMLLGIGGAVIGGWLCRQLGFPTSRGLASWAAAAGGSVLLLVLHHVATARTRAPAEPRPHPHHQNTVFDSLPLRPN